MGNRAVTIMAGGTGGHIFPGLAVAEDKPEERAIELGLEFLARNQLTGGSWELSRFDSSNPNSSMLFANPTAATGLAMVAFQGAGYHHKDYKYARNMTASVPSRTALATSNSSDSRGNRSSMTSPDAVVWSTVSR